MLFLSGFYYICQKKYHCQGLSWEFEKRVPITNKSSNFRGEAQHFVVKLPKSAGARQYCPKIPWVPGTLGTCGNSSPDFDNFYMPNAYARAYTKVFNINNQPGI